VRVTDRGSGVDWATAVVRIDGRERKGTFGGGELRVETAGLAVGRHQLRLQISDFQETRNMENVAAVLPNTRFLTASFAVVR
jgi:hypothetical protein